MICVSGQNRSGFSLMELLFAILIIGIIIAGSFYMINQIQNTVKRRQTDTNLKMLKMTLDLYQNEKDKYPTKLDELKPKYLSKLPKDGWGNNFYYRVTPGAKHPYELASYGPEGPGSPKGDRISVWD